MHGLADLSLDGAGGAASDVEPHSPHPWSEDSLPKAHQGSIDNESAIAVSYVMARIVDWSTSGVPNDDDDADDDDDDDGDDDDDDDGDGDGDDDDDGDDDGDDQ
eukprot:2098092-Amphidinium_carterae.1